MKDAIGQEPWLIIQIRPEAPGDVEAFEFIENVSSREEAIAEFLRRAGSRWGNHPICAERLGAIRATAFDAIKLDFKHEDLISYCAKIGLPPRERKALLGCFEEIFEEAYWREIEAQDERETGIPLSSSMWGKGG